MRLLASSFLSVRLSGSPSARLSVSMEQLGSHRTDFHEIWYMSIIPTSKNTHFTLNKIFFRKSCCLWGNVEKYGTAGQATDDNTAHAHCMFDNYGYKHTLRECDNAFPRQQRLRKRASILRLYVHFLCWYFYFTTEHFIYCFPSLNTVQLFAAKSPPKAVLIPSYNWHQESPEGNKR
jgi:hypothetical protein